MSADLFGDLIPSVFLLPLLAAALCLVVSRRPRVQNVITIITLSALLVISGILLVLTDSHGMHTVQVGGWDAPVGITLVADRLSALMLCVSAVVLLTVIIYAVGQGVRDGGDLRIGRFAMVDRFEDFAAVYRHVRRRLDAQADLVPADIDDRHRNLLGDDDALVALS